MIMSSNSNQQPIGLRSRVDRWSAKVLGGLTILLSFGLITKWTVPSIIGGVVMLYGGLLLFPITRTWTSAGKLGFTKLRRFVAHVLWMALSVLGLMIAQPWW